MELHGLTFPLPERQSRATFGCLKEWDGELRGLGSANVTKCVSEFANLQDLLLPIPSFLHSKRMQTLASFSSRNNGKYASLISFSITSL